VSEFHDAIEANRAAALETVSDLAAAGTAAADAEAANGHQLASLQTDFDSLSTAYGELEHDFGVLNDQYEDLLSSGPAPATPKGVSLGGLFPTRPPAEQEIEVALLAEAGATWLRVDFNWSAIEPTATTQDYTLPDRLVNLANKHGLTLLPALMSTPAWARPAGTDWRTFPTDPAKYGAFCARIANRYKADITHYELWNEPNSPSFMATPSPSKYVALLTVGSQSIKFVQPSAKVLTGSVAPALTKAGTATEPPSFSPYDWIAALYYLGAKDYFDIIGYHPYCWPLYPGDTTSWSTWFQADAVRALVAQVGDDAKLWATEFGAPTGGNDNPQSEANQGEMIAQAIQEWPDGPVFIYSGRDLQAPGATTNREDYFGMLRKDYSAKLSLDRFREAVPNPSQPAPTPAPEPTPTPTTTWTTKRVLSKKADWASTLIEEFSGASITDTATGLQVYLPGPQTADGGRVEVQDYLGVEGQLCAYDYGFRIERGTVLSNAYPNAPKNILSQHHADERGGYTGGLSAYPDGRVSLRVKGGSELSMQGSHPYAYEGELFIPGRWQFDVMHRVRLEILWKRDKTGFARARLDLGGWAELKGIPTWPIGEADGVPSTKIMYRHGLYPQGGIVQGPMKVTYAPLLFQVGS